MEFLKFSASAYNKYIVKLSVTAKQTSTFDQYVFVFSECMDESSSSHGYVNIELVPERKIPIFHENLPKIVKREIKDEEFADCNVRISDWITISKDIGDFTTNYIAKIQNPNIGQLSYHLLATRNRGKVGKLERIPSLSFALEFQLVACKYQAEQTADELETSAERVRQLEGVSECRDEIIVELERKKSQVQEPTVVDCLRAFQQGDRAQ